MKCFWQPSFVPENLSLQMKQKLNLSLKTQGRVIARCTCQYGYLSRCQALKSTLFKFLSLLAASFKPYCCPSFLDRQLYDQDWQVFSTHIFYRSSYIEYYSLLSEGRITTKIGCFRTRPGQVMLPPQLSYTTGSNTICTKSLTKVPDLSHLGAQYEVKPQCETLSTAAPFRSELWPLVSDQLGKTSAKWRHSCFATRRLLKPGDWWDVYYISNLTISALLNLKGIFLSAQSFVEL